MTISVGFDGPLHPLLWRRLPGDALVPATPRDPEEALGMMERCHAASAALLQDDPVTEGETVPLSVPWFDAVREACARTGPVPGVERHLLEWWVTDPPAEGLTQLPWLFGVWQGHWVCWAGTTPWAAADQKVTTTWDRDAFESAVRFGSDPEHPPADPWTVLGTSALAVPTVILLALVGKPATGAVRLPVTPTPRPEPAPEPPVESEAVSDVSGAPAPSLDVLEGRIPPPPGAPETDAPVPTSAEPVAADAEAAEAAEVAMVAEGAVASDEAEVAEVEGDAPEPPAAPAPEEEPAPAGVTPDDEGAATDEPVEEPAASDGGAAEPAVGPEPAVEPEPAAEPEAAVAAAGAEAAPPGEVAPIEAPPTPTLPPADWYADPTGRHQLRYWDGSQWTEHAADQATGQVVDPL